MKFNRILSGFAAVVAVLVLSQVAAIAPAKSSTENGILVALRETIDYYWPEYQRYRDILQSKDPADWTREEINLYLETALNLAHNVMGIYLIENHRYPADPNDLKTTTELAEWPANPFSGEPIGFIGTDDEFSPGSIVFQTNNGRLHCYDMSILGPSPDWMDNDQPKFWRSRYSDWVKLPEGFIAAVGEYSPAR